VNLLQLTNFSHAHFAAHIAAWVRVNLNEGWIISSQNGNEGCTVPMESLRRTLTFCGIFYFWASPCDVVFVKRTIPSLITWHYNRLNIERCP